VFCDEHAEAKMLDLQKPGLFTQTGWDGTKMDYTVNKLTNSPLEDDCRHELTKRQWRTSKRLVESACARSRPVS
jgi:hypothetical protein